MTKNNNLSVFRGDNHKQTPGQNDLQQTLRHLISGSNHYNEHDLEHFKDLLFTPPHDQSQINSSLHALRKGNLPAYQKVCEDHSRLSQLNYAVYKEAYGFIDKYKMLTAFYHKCEQKMLEVFQINNHVGYALFLVFKNVIDFSDPYCDIQEDDNQIKDLLDLIEFHKDNGQLTILLQQILENLQSNDDDDKELALLKSYELYQYDKQVGLQILNLLTQKHCQFQSQIDIFLKYQGFLESIPSDLHKNKSLNQLLSAFYEQNEVKVNQHIKVLETLSQDQAQAILKSLQINYPEIFSSITDEKLLNNLQMPQQVQNINNASQTNFYDRDQNLQEQTSNNSQQVQLMEQNNNNNDNNTIESAINRSDIDNLIMIIKQQQLKDDQILELLDTLLKQQNIRLYEGVIVNFTHIFKNNREYESQLGYIERYYTIQDKICFIQERIEELYNDLPHHSYSLYLQFKDRCKLKSPIEGFNEQQNFSGILKKIEDLLTRINYKKELTQDFLKAISENQTQDIIKQALDIKSINDDTFADINELLKSLSEEIYYALNYKIMFNRLIEDLSQGLQDLNQIDNYLRCIENNNPIESKAHINQVLFLEQDQAQFILNQVQKYFPGFSEIIPQYKILLINTKVQLKQITHELIETLEQIKSDSQFASTINQRKIDELNQTLKQIHQEQPELIDTILDKYQDQFLALNLQNPQKQYNPYDKDKFINIQSTSGRVDPNQHLIDAICDNNKDYLLEVFHTMDKELLYSILSKCYDLNIELYKELVISSNIQELDKVGYEQVKKYLELNWKNKKRTSKCQQKIDDYYQKNQHQAYALYLLYKQKVQLIDPYEVACLQKQLTKFIEQITESQTTFQDQPEEEQKNSSIQSLIVELMTLFQDKELNEFVDKIIELNQQQPIIGEQLIDLLKETSSQLHQIVQNQLQYQKFITSLPSELTEIDVIQEFLSTFINGDIDLVNKKFDLILIIQSHNIDTLLQAIQKYYPNIYKNISQEKLLFAKCPLQQKSILQTLATKLKNLTDGDLINPGIQDKTKKTKLQEYYEVDENFQPDVIEQKLIESYQETKRLQRQLLVKLLFHYMKRRLDFNHIIQKFLKFDMNFPITRSILILYLLENADEYLRILIMVSLSLYVPIPLYGNSLVLKEEQKQQNNVSLEQLKNQVIIPKELIFVYERFKSVFNFCITNNENDCPSGYDKFINKLYNKNFDPLNENLSNYGTVEVQFDYNFCTPQYIPVANCQGPVSLEKLQKIMIIFNVFIIHVKKHDQALVSKYINCINNYLNEEKLIIIIEHDNFCQQPMLIKENEQSSFQEITQQNQTTLYHYKVNPLQNINEAMSNNLCEEIIELIRQFQESKPDAYLANIKRRMNTIESYNVMLKSNNIQNDDVQDAIRNSSSIIDKIYSNSQDLHSYEFLPMNYLFEQSCQLQFSLNHDNELNSQTRAKKDERRQKLLKKMESQKAAPIVIDLIKIIKDHQAIGCFMIINKITKGYLNYQLKEIYQNRQQLRDEIQTMMLNKNIDLDKDDAKYNELLQSKINEAQEITNDIEKKSFSYEYIIRELYLLGNLSSSKNDKIEYQRQYFELSHQLLDSTQPFEIIDGNNLSFISDVYDEIFKNSKDELFVVSVIGPQSSGKSLLLNFLFGTQFQSSEGRCTKGVYGALINVKTDGNKRKRILILDTEGIQAAEARDDRFDRRIVFYILCVSHVVLICNKGEMNSQMAEILKLAAESISNLKENIIQPSVFVVMNMLASTDNAALSECIQKLSSAISEIGSQNTTQQLFQLSSRNVNILPFAFDRSGKDELIINQPSLDFSVKLEPLKQKIIDCMKKVFQGEKKMSTSSWFEYACKFWNFSEQFKGLMEYKNLEQKIMEAGVRSKIIQLVQSQFEDKVQDNKNMVDEIIKEDLKQFEGVSSVKFNIIYSKIETSVLEKFLEMEKQALDEFTLYCQHKSVTFDINSRNQPLLRGQLHYYKEQWKNQVKEKVSQFVEQKSKRVGFARLNEIITSLLKAQSRYSQEEAAELFEQKWKIIEDEIISNLRSEDLIRQETQKHVNNTYQQQMNQSYYANSQRDNEILQEFYRRSNGALLNEFQTLFQDFLYFTGNNVQPNSQKFIGSQSMNKKFIKNLDQNIFQVRTKITVYNWKKFIQERIDRSHLAKVITELLRQTKWWGLKEYYDNSKLQEIQQVFRNLNVELNHMNIELRKQFFNDSNQIMQVLKSFNYFKDIKTFEELQQLTQIYFDNALFQETDKYFQYTDINQRFQLKDRYPYQHLQSNRIQLKNEHYQKRPFKIDDYVYNIDGEQNMAQLEDILVLDNQRQIFFGNKSKISINTKNYLQYLAGTLKKTGTLDKSQYTPDGVKFVFNLLNLDVIVDEVESIVIKKLKSDGLREDKENITNLIADLKMEKGDELKNKLIKLNTNVVQDVAVDVKALIQQLDEQLDRFALRISEKGISLLHLFAKVFLITLSEQLEIKLGEGSLDALRQGKEQQQQLFIAKLTSNQDELDQIQAIKLAADIKQYFTNQLTEQAKLNFDNQYNRQQSTFDKQKVLKQIEDDALDMAQQHAPLQSYDQYGFLADNQIQEEEVKGQIIQQSRYQAYGNIALMGHAEADEQQLQNIIQFYKDPRKFFSNQFNILWKGFSIPVIKKIRDTYKSNFHNLLTNTHKFFEQLQSILQSVNCDEASISLFIMVDDEENNNEISQQLSQPQHKATPQDLNEKANKCASQYLIQMVKRDIPDNRIILVDNVKMRCGQDSNPLPRPLDMTEYISDDLQNLIEQSLRDVQISRLNKFLKIFNNEIYSQIIKDQEFKDDNVLIGDKMQLLQTKFLGCGEYCPLCRMQCDVPHQPNEPLPQRIHQCTQGHRIQAFGGNKNLNGNAVVITCSDLKDNNEVVYQGKTMKWSNFQQEPNFGKWQFKVDDQSELAMWKQKNIILWNYFGKLICEIYQRKDNIDMIFKEAQERYYSDIHYVLLLDTSGSMEGQRWEDLMSSVSKFMEIVSQDIKIQKHSKVTVITYNVSVEVVFEEKVPDMALLDLIKFQGGWTNFSEPIKYMRQCMQKYIDKYDKFIVCFMTDGQDSYPMQELELVVQDEQLMKKLDFRCLLQGEDTDGEKVLKDIATKLNGTMKKCIETADLKEEFIKLVPNIYQ